MLTGMIETLRIADNGIGLAAPQVGVSAAVAVIILEPLHDAIVLVNPRITKVKGIRHLPEGCLSLPGQVYEVAHARVVWVDAQDASGASRRIEASGLLAQAIEHEVDHLHGKLIDVVGTPMSLFARAERNQ